jgi:hypothetical protein
MTSIHFGAFLGHGGSVTLARVASVTLGLVLALASCLHPQQGDADRTYQGDQWVRAELRVLGDSLITHIVDEDTVLQYSRPQLGGGMVQGYDPAIWEPGKPLTDGYIALQSEGQPIDFRRVELLDLEGCTDPGATNYRSYLIRSDPAVCTYADGAAR